MVEQKREETEPKVETAKESIEKESVKVTEPKEEPIQEAEPAKESEAAAAEV